MRRFHEKIEQRAFPGNIEPHRTSLTMADVSIMMPLSRLGPLWAVLWSYFFLWHIERVIPRIFFAAVIIVAGGGPIMAFK